MQWDESHQNYYTAVTVQKSVLMEILTIEYLKDKVEATYKYRFKDE